VSLARELETVQAMGRATVNISVYPEYQGY
jgi:hypothetical protein